MARRNRLKRVTTSILATCVPERLRMRVGRFLLDHARAENNGNPFTNGEYRLLAAIKGRITGNAVFFDVGANTGEWTLQACAGLHEGFRVVACEPSRASYARLVDAVAAFTPAVTALNVALGNTDATAVLYAGTRCAGTSSLYQRAMPIVGPVEPEVVTARRGDALCDELRIQRIEFLKIDTEGHELCVLKGFERMLSEHRIDCVQFEYGGTWLDSRTHLADAYAWLAARGYAVGRLFPDGVRFAPPAHVVEDSFQFSNHVAARPELVPALTRL